MTNDYSAQNLSSNEAMMYMAMLTVYGIVLLLAYVIRSIALGRIFVKAGQPAWKAWVPVYNQWILLQLGGQPGWWSIIMLVPLINIVAVIFLYIAMYQVGLKLRKSGWFVLWGIFMPIVWYVWLASDDSKWNDKLGAPRLDTTAKKPAHDTSDD